MDSLNKTEGRATQEFGSTYKGHKESREDHENRRQQLLESIGLVSLVSKEVSALR